MYILYIYKIKINNKQAKNAIMRRFYYNFKKLLIKDAKKVFRSAFYINTEKEDTIDKFFNEYSEWIDVFKARVESFEFITRKQTYEHIE